MILVHFLYLIVSYYVKNDSPEMLCSAWCSLRHCYVMDYSPEISTFMLVVMAAVNGFTGCTIFNPMNVALVISLFSFGFMFCCHFHVSMLYLSLF